MEEIIETYNNLAKKYPLPDFSLLDSYFEISQCELSDFLLTAIRRKIIEKIDHYAKILDELLQPDTSLKSMQEFKFFDDAEKENIFSIYKKLMFFIRKADLINILIDNKNEAELISEIFSEWQQLSKSLSAIMSKLESSWSSYTDNIDKSLGYFG